MPDCCRRAENQLEPDQRDFLIRCSHCGRIVMPYDLVDSNGPNMLFSLALWGTGMAFGILITTLFFILCIK